MIASSSWRSDRAAPRRHINVTQSSRDGTCDRLIVLAVRPRGVAASHNATQTPHDGTSRRLALAARHALAIDRWRLSQWRFCTAPLCATFRHAHYYCIMFFFSSRSRARRRCVLHTAICVIIGHTLCHGVPSGEKLIAIARSRCRDVSHILFHETSWCSVRREARCDRTLAAAQATKARGVVVVIVLVVLALRRRRRRGGGDGDDGVAAGGETAARARGRDAPKRGDARGAS